MPRRVISPFGAVAGAVDGRQLVAPAVVGEILQDHHVRRVRLAILLDCHVTLERRQGMDGLAVVEMMIPRSVGVLELKLSRMTSAAIAETM